MKRGRRRSNRSFFSHIQSSCPVLEVASSMALHFVSILRVSVDRQRRSEEKIAGIGERCSEGPNKGGSWAMGANESKSRSA